MSKLKEVRSAKVRFSRSFPVMNVDYDTADKCEVAVTEFEGDEWAVFRYESVSAVVRLLGKADTALAVKRTAPEWSDDANVPAPNDDQFTLELCEWWFGVEGDPSTFEWSLG